MGAAGAASSPSCWGGTAPQTLGRKEAEAIGSESVRGVSGTWDLGGSPLTPVPLALEQGPGADSWAQTALGLENIRTEARPPCGRRLPPREPVGRVGDGSEMWRTENSPVSGLNQRGGLEMI